MPRKKKETKQEKVEQQKLEENNSDTKVLAIIFLLVSLFLLIMIMFNIGLAGAILNNILSFIFGPAFYVVLFTSLIISAYYLFFKKKHPVKKFFFVGFIILNVACFILSGYLVYGGVKIDISYLTTIFTNITKLFSTEYVDLGSGILGTLLYFIFVNLFDSIGTLIFIIILFIIAIILIIPLSFFGEIKEAIKKSNQKHKERKLQEQQAERERRRKAHEARMRKEEERKLRLAEEMNNAVPEEEVYEEEVIEEEPIEEDHSDVLSQTSEYWINLNKEEINKKIDEDVEIKTNDDTQEINFASNPESHDETSKATTVATNTQAQTSDAPKQENKTLKVIKTHGAYHLPPISLLESSDTKDGSNINRTSSDLKGKKLIDILKTFDIPATLVATHIGPSVTKFEIKPDTDVKINRILAISDNLKMELAAKDIRIEAPIPGRSAVGIEIPNAEMEPVKLGDLMKTIPASKKSCRLLFALGKDLMGKGVYCELDKMPHLLIAGATGSGKSVCINTILMSYLMRTNPDDVKLVLIDPKKVEFTPYHNIPHLLWPVITDTKMAALMLQKVVVIMEDRYDKFADMGVRNIQGFNDAVAEHNRNLKEGETPLNRLPNIVVIIDELADLMAIAGKEVELSIQRLTQLARASGIHLIVATQRPSTDVITGIIKSNIPSRISFAVASSIDSRTILDQTGAERLLGLGDMLYFPQGETAPIRLQGAFVSDLDIQKVTSFTKKEAQPAYDDFYYQIQRTGEASSAYSGAGDNNGEDALYDDVVEYVKESQKASTSLLQRKFGIGYNRAARLIDTLEEKGIIGPPNGSKPREVYVKKDPE